MPSPWAEIRNSTRLDTPPPDMGPWAPVDSMPSLSTPQPKVTEDPIAQNIDQDQQRLQDVRWHQAHGFGTPENHPGKLGKLAHVFANVGNIAGNIVAPDVMARIPGTKMQMATEEGNLTGRLNKELEDKSLQEQQGATTRHLNAETPEVAPNAQSQRALQGAQAGNLESETKIREHPLPEYSPLQFITPEGQATEMEKHTGAITPAGPEGLHYGRIQDKFQHVNGTVNGAPTAAFADPLNHQYVDQDGTPIPNFKPMPQPAMMGPVVVSPDTGKVRRATPGTVLPEGFRTVTQQGAMNTPTMQMRNVGAQAQLVTEQMPGLIHEIQQNAALLGPVSGRWNEFMQGRVGMDNPQMAGLRSDLLMMSSAVALMHARGRLPENLREEFDAAINAPKQTPENLIATLQHIGQWTAANMQTMTGQHPAETPQPTQNVKRFNPATGRLE